MRHIFYSWIWLNFVNSFNFRPVCVASQISSWYWQHCSRSCESELGHNNIQQHSPGLHNTLHSWNNKEKNYPAKNPENNQQSHHIFVRFWSRTPDICGISVNDQVLVTGAIILMGVAWKNEKYTERRRVERGIISNLLVSDVMIKLNRAQNLTSDTTILCSLYWKAVVCPTSPVRKSAFIKYLIEISQNNPHPEKYYHLQYFQNWWLFQ